MAVRSVSDAEQWLVGIDLGGTKILGLLLDAGATVYARVRRDTPPSGGNRAISASVIDVIRELLRIARSYSRVVEGIAICSPGFIDSDGRILDASNLQVIELPLRALVEQAFGLRTLVLHDVSAAALGETYVGAATAAHHVAFCNIGTGIGAGLVFDGQLYRGAAGRAGELGHVCVQRNGPLCTCGKRGCLEAVASGMALVQQARTALVHERNTPLAELVEAAGGHIRVELIAQAAAAGDTLARTLLIDAAEQIGIAVAGMIHLLDLDCVVFGGGVAQIGALFLEPLRATVREYVFDVYQNIALPTSLLGTDAGAIGAVTALMSSSALGSSITSH